MTLKTVPVTGTIYKADGTVCASTLVVATLTVSDTDASSGEVVPSQITATTDSGGVFTLNLWPNTRGTYGRSQYMVRANLPDALPGVLVLNDRITVPDSDPAVPIQIGTIVNRTGPSTLTDAQAAMLAAQAALVQAQQVLATAIAVGADLPNLDAVAAALTNLNALAADLTNLSALGADLANVNALAGIISSLNALAADLTNINAVAADKANIDAVAGDKTNIDAVATALAAINTCATSIAAIQGAPAAAQSAANSASQAQTYATAAGVNATYYNTIALGLAGTADGKTFGVIAGGSDGLARPTVYQRINSTTASVIGAWVTGTEFDKTIGDPVLKASFMVTGKNDVAVVRVVNTMDVQDAFLVDASGGMSTSTLSVNATPMLKYQSGVIDKNGCLGWAVDTSGKIVGNASATVGRTSFKTTGLYTYDIYYKPMYGQSLSIGQATPAISKVAYGASLMFTYGMRPQYDYPTNTDAQNYASFVPAVEADSPVNSSLGETPARGIADMFTLMMLRELGLNWTSQNCQPLVSTPGYGALPLSGLVKGTTPYTRMMTQVQYGRTNALAQNKSFSFQNIGLLQGETDYQNGTTQATWYSEINQFATDLNTDVLAAIPEQTEPVHVVICQIDSHKVGGSAVPTIALAQYQASLDNPHIHIAVPTYICQHQDNQNFHLTPFFSRLMGEYAEYAAGRIVHFGETWTGVRPIDTKIVGNCVYIRCTVPWGHLVLDTNLVALNANYGFELFNSDNATANPITAVGLRGRDWIKLTATNPVQVNSHIHYAWSGDGNVGNTVGPRGNVRDQQGENLPGHEAVISTEGYPMHNWLQIVDLIATH